MERRAVTLRGIVQGVGLRPVAYTLAKKLNLSGSVKNRTDGVHIEIEGPAENLDKFLSAIVDEAPPLAKIHRISWKTTTPTGIDGFLIEASETKPQENFFVSPDASTCAECLRDLFDEKDRHYLYPFVNCTQCGPRLTATRSAPYDRIRTTMATFEMCPDCRREYEDPTNRRFHAEPIACPSCGPKLKLVDEKGQTTEGDVLSLFSEKIRRGKIGALKGLGGFHFVCDAQNDAAVHLLRLRKVREEKPFAVMMRDLTMVRQYCEVSAVEEKVLTSWRSPIVLLRTLVSSQISKHVAPRHRSLGVMLPYTPLHHLLSDEIKAPLVMTSGNCSDEPIATNNDEAKKSLATIADVFLLHDRDIHVRCDDSVVHIVKEKEQPIRRSRGYAPEPLNLPIYCAQPILAVGGQFKATFALARDEKVILSHHLGDLDHLKAYHSFCSDIELYQELFNIQPEVVAHDLHPDYASTRFANETKWQKKIAVQHHHAHMASCMVENGLNEDVIGVIWDGTGFGTDGNIWGGEFLVGGYSKVERAAHFRYVQMPGGAQAILHPWRMALSYLKDSKVSANLHSRQKTEEWNLLEKLSGSGIFPLTSSAGRLFDVVSSLLGLRDSITFEGQAAMELEALANDSKDDDKYPFGCCSTTHWPIEIDMRFCIKAIVDDIQRGTKRETIARQFHSTLSQVIVDICNQIREKTGLNKVVLSGGVFLNRILAEETLKLLSDENFKTYTHTLVPPNDGGLSLGQVAVAAAKLGESLCV